MHLIKSGGVSEEKLFFSTSHAGIKDIIIGFSKIKIAQTMNITKHNNKNGTTMRRSTKLFLHRCCNSVVSMNGLKKYDDDDDEENV